MNSDKALKIILILLFSSVLLVPLILIDTTPGKISEIDNRRLTDMPPFTSRKVTAYVQDRLGLRAEMMESFALINGHIFKVMDHPLYDSGKNGYTFFTINAETSDPDYVRDYTKFVSKVQNYCESNGIEFLFWLTPQKSTTYKEYLPPKGRLLLTGERMAWLKAGFNNFKVKNIITEDLFEKIKTNQQLFNVKFDAGHWNNTGALVGFSQLIDELRKNFPHLQPLKKEDFSAKTVTRREMLLTYYQINEKDILYQPVTTQAEPDNTYMRVVRRVPAHPYFQYFVNQKNSNLPKLLLFGGSYMQGREKFIYNNFSELAVVHNYANIFDLVYYINIFQPDIVVFEAAEYTINSSYFNRQSLVETNFPPAYSEFEFFLEKDFCNVTAIKTPPDIRPLRSLVFEITGERAAYAYAKINDQWLNAGLSQQGGKQFMEITTKAENISPSGVISLALISEELGKQKITQVSID